MVYALETYKVNITYFGNVVLKQTVGLDSEKRFFSEKMRKEGKRGY